MSQTWQLQNPDSSIGLPDNEVGFITIFTSLKSSGGIVYATSFEAGT